MIIVELVMSHNLGLCAMGSYKNMAFLRPVKYRGTNRAYFWFEGQKIRLLDCKIA